MLSIHQLPKSFQVPHKSPSWSSFIELQFTAGATPEQWNGYHRSHRIMLHATDREWLVRVLKDGIHLCILRWPRANPTFNDIQILIQCACYYIDSITPNEEEGHITGNSIEITK